MLNFTGVFDLRENRDIRRQYIESRGSRWRSSIQSAKTRPGADCDSNHEIFIAKFRLKLKKVGKDTRPFKYDLNQIPYPPEKLRRLKQPLCAPGPRDPTETEPELCLSVSCGDMGQ